ncbi:MAG: helix-turn-helix transcriptional regulator [Chloroflexota bacterium]|nr:helix-turn-helix transcriptional regulator [Chloroflexota bacterium]
MLPERPQTPIGQMVGQTARQTMGQSVGAKIRAARLAKKYTQNQLAAPDFSVSYISAIERGQIHPSLRALEILAQRLELHSTQLLSEHLQSLDDKFISLPTSQLSEDEIGIILLDAHLSLLQGEPSLALINLEQLTLDHLQSRKQIHYFYLLAWTFFATDQFQQSVKILSEADQLCQKQGAPFFHERILNLSGIVHSAMHNYVQAIHCHQECLTYIQNAAVSDPFLLSQVYTHLGQHYSHMDNLDAALKMFKEATTIAEQLTDIPHVQAVYWKLSQYYTEAEENEVAALYAYKCLHAYNQQASTLKREIYHHLGRAMLMGDQEEARTYLEKALEQETIQQDQLITASTTTYMAEWFFMHEQLDKAEKYSQKAHRLTLPFGDTIMAVEALLLLGRISYDQSRYEVGDTYFVAGLEMLERLSISDELADQSVLYAQLLEERGKEREALIYYRKAFEHCQKIGAYHR